MGVEEHGQKYGCVVAGLKIEVPWCADDKVMVVIVHFLWAVWCGCLV